MKYIVILFLLLMSSAWASETPQAWQGTVVSLSATAESELPNDEVIVRYRIEATGTNVSKLRQQVNSISQVVHARLKREQKLKQTTLGRRLEMFWRYDKISRKQVCDGWKLVQREQVSSRNLDAVPDWVDTIEKAGAHLDNLNFRISGSSSKAAQESLRLQAVKQFRAKAATLAQALDAPSFRILSLQTSSRMPVYPMRAERAIMKTSADATPSFNAGEGKISVTVSGEVLLPPKDFPAK